MTMQTKWLVLHGAANKAEYEQQLDAYLKAVRRFEYWGRSVKLHGSTLTGTFGADAVLRSKDSSDAILIEAKHYADAYIDAPEVKEEPPKWAKYVLLLLPIRDRECIVGDLEEKFRTVLLPEYGPTRARFWYWVQVTSEITSFASACIKRVAGLEAFFKLFR